MLLTPQHFQASQQWVEGLVANVYRQILPQAWGILSVQWDDPALKDGVLKLDHVEAIFADGAYIASPHISEAPCHRELSDIESSLTEVTVFLCLPVWQESQSNVESEDHQQALQIRRFYLRSDTRADMLSDAEPTELLSLRLRTVLRFEQEPQDGFWRIPVAVLKRNASGYWVRDEKYIPPVLSIHASNKLVSLLESLREMLLAKSQSLALLHRERSEGSFEYSSRDIAAFWLHHTVNHAFPNIDVLINNPVASPLDAYRALSSLAASLMVFSPQAQLAELAPYEPMRLGDTFSRLMQLIRDLLDTVVSTRFMRIVLSEIKPTLLAGQLSADWNFEKIDMYLGIRADVPSTEWVQAIPLRVKLGTPDDVERILHTALPGIRLIHSPSVPASLPVRIGQVYFAVDRTDELYQRMLHQRSVSLYLPDTMRHFEFELIAVHR
jgi:type VI secretion system protein ImpJ